MSSLISITWYPTTKLDFPDRFVEVAFRFPLPPMAPFDDEEEEEEEGPLASWSSRYRRPWCLSAVSHWMFSQLNRSSSFLSCPSWLDSNAPVGLLWLGSPFGPGVLQSNMHRQIGWKQQPHPTGMGAQNYNHQAMESESESTYRVLEDSSSRNLSVCLLILRYQPTSPLQLQSYVM